MNTLSHNSLRRAGNSAPQETLRTLLTALAEAGLGLVAGIVGVSSGVAGTKGRTPAARKSVKPSTLLAPDAATVLDAIAKALADVTNQGAAIHRSMLTAALAELNVSAIKGTSRVAPAIHINEDDDELTTEEAAALLFVSRPYLVKLVDTKKIPLAQRTQGGQRRVRKSDVLRYKAEMKRIQDHALDELVSESEKLNLYAPPPNKKPSRRKR